MVSLGKSGARKALYFALGALAAILAARTIVLAYLFFRPIPYWDQWEFTKSLPSIFSGHYGLSDLFAFHNEHRIVTSRLIFIIDAMLFSSAGFFPSTLLIAVLLSTACLLSFVAEASPRKAAWLTVLVSGCLLSIAHSDNFSSGFQIQFPLVDAFGLLSILCIACEPKKSFQSRILVCFCVAFLALAIFSMASGNVVIASILIVGIMLRVRAWKLIAVTISSAIMSVIYFVGYPSPDVAHSYNPLAVLRFTVAYLGSALRGYPHAPTVLGSVLLATYVAAFVLLLRDRLLGRAVDRRAACLIGLATFVLAGAAITATGRLTLGLEAAVVSRYALQSLLFASCLFLFVWRVAPRLPRPVALRGAAAVAFMALVTVSTLAALSMREWRDRVADYDVAGFALSSDVVTQDAMVGVYPHLDLIQPVLGFMREHRLGPFSAAYASVFRPPTNAAEGQNTPTCQGHIDSVDRDGPHRLWMHGWIAPPSSPSENGWIVATDQTGRLLGSGRQELSRPDVASALGGDSDRTGFAIGLDLNPKSVNASRDVLITLVPAADREPACHIDFVAPNP